MAWLRRQEPGVVPNTLRKHLQRCAWSTKPQVAAIWLKLSVVVSINFRARSMRALMT